MSTPLESLIASGTKLWLDSVDPDLVQLNRSLGATGATSNPIIIADLIQSGRFDDDLQRLLSDSSLDNSAVAWRLTDQVVQNAQQAFHPVWQSTGGDDGWVSFEIDPLLEDPSNDLSHANRVSRYVELGKHWAAEHDNRMIKVPATPAGLDALEPLAAAGVTLNVTLIFTMRQYELARDAIWRGAQQCDSLERFKSVYSIFISRIDVYTEKQIAELSDAAQGEVGVVNVKRIWRENQRFWKEHPTPLAQEIVFASTGAKRPGDPPWKYVQALAGSDIQTNPPATNEAVQQSDLAFERTVDQLPPAPVLEEIDSKVDFQQLETTLMAEGVEKFTKPQKSLLALVEEMRKKSA